MGKQVREHREAPFRRSYKPPASPGIFARPRFVGLAILCSLALLGPAVTLAAEGAGPAAGSQKAGEKTAQADGVQVPTYALHGTVVDAKGNPVPHVKVATSAGRDPDVDLATVTGAAGNFTLDVPTWQMRLVLWAKDEAAGRIGSLHYAPGKTRPEARIVLHRGRSIPVTVVDRKGQPIVGATIGVSFANRNGVIYYDRIRENIVREQTDAKGQAVLHLPVETPLESVWAVKAGVGFDYVLYRTPFVQRRQNKPLPPEPAKRAPEDSRPIKFVFGGVHKLRVHVLNERHRPLPGVSLHATYLERPNRGGGARVAQIDQFVATTDSTGTASFDAIPIEAISDVDFASVKAGYHIEGNATFAPSETLMDVTVVATQLPVLRVQVTYPDGRPALGASLYFTARYYGRTKGLSYGSHLYHAPGETMVRTFRGDAYCVVSATIDGFASNLEARVARMGEPLRPVHLVLQPATRLHGTLTVGKERRPAANESVTLIERDQDNYSKLPEDERLPRTLPLAEREHVVLDLPLHTTTDEQGRFQFDAARGAYLIGAGHVALGDIRRVKDVKEAYREGARELEIKDEKEIAIDLHIDVPLSAIKRSRQSRSQAPAKPGS